MTPMPARLRSRWTTLLLSAPVLAACSGGGTEPEGQGFRTPIAATPTSGLFPLPVCDADASPDLDPTRRDSVPPETWSTSDTEWAEVARVVPGGWGGAFLVNQRLTMYLVEPDSAEAAAEALNELGVGRELNLDFRTADVWKGDWDFAQLYDWRRYVRYLQVRGIVSSDADELRNRITYHILEGDYATAMSRLEGASLPCGLIEVATAVFPESP